MLTVGAGINFKDLHGSIGSVSHEDKIRLCDQIRGQRLEPSSCRNRN